MADAHIVDRRDVILLTVEALVNAKGSSAGDINSNAFHSGLQKILHHAKKKIDLETIFGANPESFCNAVSKGKVVHITSFGSVDGLVLENAKIPGQSLTLMEEEIATLLSSPSVTLETCLIVVLSKHAKSAAKVLVEAGIPCVVAIQFTNGIKLEEEVEKFLKAFYHNILEGGQIRSAFEGAISSRKDKTLFTILGDGSLQPYEAPFESAKFQDFTDYRGRYRLATPIYTFFSNNTVMYGLIESYLKADTITWIAAFEGSGKSAMLTMSSWYCACRKIFENILYINVSTSDSRNLWGVVSQALRKKDQQNEQIYARTTVSEVYLTITKEKIEKSGPFLENCEDIEDASSLVQVINDRLKGSSLLILDSALASSFSDQEVLEFATYLSEQCPGLKVVISSSQAFQLDDKGVDVKGIPRMKSSTAMKLLLSQCEETMVNTEFQDMSEKDIIKRLKKEHFIGALLSRYALPGIVKMIAQTLTLSNLKFSNIPEQKLIEIVKKVQPYHMYLKNSEMERTFLQRLADMNARYNAVYGGGKTPRSKPLPPKPKTDGPEIPANLPRNDNVPSRARHSPKPRPQRMPSNQRRAPSITKEAAERWTKEQVGDFIANMGTAYEKYRELIICQGIDGSCFTMLKEADTLAELGITSPLHKKVISKKVEQIVDA